MAEHDRRSYPDIRGFRELIFLSDCLKGVPVHVHSSGHTASDLSDTAT